MRSNARLAARLAIASALLTSLIGEARADHRHAHFSASNLHPFPSGEELGGATTLVRNPWAVRMTLHATELEAGIYTVWWVVFNKPEHCSDGICDRFDALPPPGNQRARVSVLWAAGGIVGEDGVGNFAAHLARRRPLPGQVVWGDPRGLLDPLGSEIHLVLQYHAEPIPGRVDEQLTRFGGGCDGDLLLNPPCSNVQSAAHLPVWEADDDDD